MIRVRAKIPGFKEDSVKNPKISWQAVGGCFVGNVKLGNTGKVDVFRIAERSGSFCLAYLRGKKPSGNGIPETPCPDLDAALQLAEDTLPSFLSDEEAAFL